MLGEIEQAVFGYGGRPVVEVDLLHLNRGRCLGLFGPNGSGKTTLIRGLIGSLAPMSGRVRRHEVAGKSLRFGYLPQHRAIDQHWPMTGFDAAAMAMSAYQRFGWIGNARAKIHESMQRLNADDLAARRFAKLSGGQQQRLLLAGALAAEPQVLVLDEPTDGLDVKSRQSLLELLQAEQRAGLCTVIISHEIQDLLAIADEIAYFTIPETTDGSSLVQIISPDDLARRVVNRTLTPAVGNPRGSP